MSDFVRRAALTCLLAAASSAAQGPTGGFPEGQAAIDEMLIHFDPVVAGRVLPVVRDLLRAVPPDVRVVVAVESQQQVDAARFWMQDVLRRRTYRVVVADAPLSPWARDRVLPLSTASGWLLVSPSQDHVDPVRWGDVLAARAMATPDARVRHACLPISFEGGNIMFTTDRVLFTRSLIVANGAGKKADERRVLAKIRAAFGRKPLPLGDPARLPHDHLDMFLTIVDDRTVLLADPRLAEGFLVDVARHGLDDGVLPWHDQWSVQAQRAIRPGYQVIERELRSAGFRILRIPVLHGREEMLSWNNALVESRGRQMRAYVPVYGLPVLDEAALRAWTRAGFRAFPIDVSRMMELGGTIRCMTNVLRWRRTNAAATGAVPAVRQP